MKIIGKASFVALLTVAAVLLFGTSCNKNAGVVNTGGLRWDHVGQSFKLDLGQDSLSGAFKFKNDSTKPVVVESVSSDCGCVSSAFAGSRYAPGDSGEIPFVFSTGSPQGVVDKTLVVKIEGEAEPVVLQLRMEIPFVVDIAPRVLSWKKGGDVTEQKVALVSTGRPYRVLRVNSVNRAFQAGVIGGKEGKAEIVVKPVDVSTARKSELIIETDCPYPAWRYVVCQLRIE